nr:hypothetical protein [uncultured Acetatifactor sp.]
MTRYPNLLELCRHHPYGEPCVCDHARIEPELLRAVLEDGELLLPAEIGGISRLYGVPHGLLECRRAAMLDMGRWRHRKLVAKIDALYVMLKCMAREGNQEAGKYLQWADRELQRFLEAAYRNRLSYGHYLGTREQLSQYIRFAAPRPKRRGMQPIKVADSCNPENETNAATFSGQQTKGDGAVGEDKGVV